MVTTNYQNRSSLIYWVRQECFSICPVKQKAELQPFPLSDTQVGTVAREYYP